MYFQWSQMCFQLLLYNFWHISEDIGVNEGTQTGKKMCSIKFRANWGLSSRQWNLIWPKLSWLYFIKNWVDWTRWRTETCISFIHDYNGGDFWLLKFIQLWIKLVTNSIPHASDSPKIINKSNTKYFTSISKSVKFSPKSEAFSIQPP